MYLSINGRVIAKINVNYEGSHNQEEINNMVRDDYKFLIAKYRHRLKGKQWEIYLSAQSKMNEKCKIEQKT